MIWIIPGKISCEVNFSFVCFQTFSFSSVHPHVSLTTEKHCLNSIIVADLKPTVFVDRLSDSLRRKTLARWRCFMSDAVKTWKRSTSQHDDMADGSRE